MNFEYYHFRLANTSISVIFALASGCRPFLRRLAEDVVFLDALLLNWMSSQPVRESFTSSKTLSAYSLEERDEFSLALGTAADSLTMIVLENGKPGKDHLARLPDEQSHVVLTLKISDVLWDRNQEEASKGPEDPEALKAIGTLVSVVRRLRIMTGIHSSRPTSWVDDVSAEAEWIEMKRNARRTLYTFPDVCDWCSRAPEPGPNGEPGELKRCSKCIFSRYCCKEHQLADWATTGLEMSQPHKHVCVDAKKAGWISAQ